MKLALSLMPKVAPHRFATILVVDDDHLVRQLLREYLTSEGYRVVQARHAIEARSAVDRHRPDRVLLDVHLPIFASLEVLRYLRVYYPQTGIILMTGDQDFTADAPRLAIGTLACLAKPLDLDHLGQIISSSLEQRTGPPASG